MATFLVIAFIFCVGSLFGWVLEVFYRRFFSSMNPERKWLNPGFCIGPWLPLYGTGLTVLFLLAILGDRLFPDGSIKGRLLMFLMMAVCMSAIEYLAGIMLLKWFQLRLWDYSDEWGNIQGLICPLFSFFWAVLGALYYFLVHPLVLDGLYWLADHLAFSFFIGLFYGVFIIDVCYSGRLISKLRRFAKENEVIIWVENLKDQIGTELKAEQKKVRFMFPFHGDRPLKEYLHNGLEKSAAASDQENHQKQHGRKKGKLPPISMRLKKK